MLKPIVSLLLLASATVCAAQPVLTAAQYAQQLGVGMDVDWARTDRGIVNSIRWWCGITGRKG